MATKKEWTDEEVQAEIREAVRIVNEDRERATYAELHSRYGQKPEGDEGDEGEGDEGDGKTKPPPAKPPKEEKKPKKSIWWAESDEESE